MALRGESAIHVDRRGSLQCPRSEMTRTGRGGTPGELGCVEGGAKVKRKEPPLALFLLFVPFDLRSDKK